MKTIHYPNKIRSHLVTIAPMAPFTAKSTSKLRFALHFRYSIVITRSFPALSIIIIITIIIRIIIVIVLLECKNPCNKLALDNDD